MVLSLVESAQVKRNGYAFRQPYAWFLQRYKMLSTVTWPHWGGVAIEGAARLLRDLPILATEYAFGRRMLFIKNDSTVKQRYQQIFPFIIYYLENIQNVLFDLPRS